MESKLNTEQQEVYAMPRIGDQAPDFKAVTTKGNIQMSDFHFTAMVLI